jgi:hypothetical protein
MVAAMAAAAYMSRGLAMADFSATIRTLHAQRQELLDQVAAIDRAVAALSGAGKPSRSVGAAVPVAAAPAVTPARPRKRRVLSEDHKRKMVEGRRRSREAARTGGAEPPSPGNGSVLGPPRLVKPAEIVPAPTVES